MIALLFAREARRSGAKTKWVLRGVSKPAAWWSRLDRRRAC